MKLLVTGAAGMLGRDVMLAAGNAGHDVVGFGHMELDVTDAASVGAQVEAERPDVVINCVNISNTGVVFGGIRHGGPAR